MLHAETAPQSFDVIVVGGGHAGVEAAHAAARMGSRTLLITLDSTKIGLMPCNPAIGGIGKGHIVFEISALGGLMPRLATKTYLQARMLNTRKGPAVQGLRLQIDKHAYKAEAQKQLRATANLTIVDGMADSIIRTQDGAVCGVITADGTQYNCSSVILTTGTFLNGLVHIGQKNHAGGRENESAVIKLAAFMKTLNLKIGRLKTGTPPRLLRSTLDFSKMESQERMDLNYLFEFHPHKAITTHDCFITHTTPETHDIVRNNLHLSAMYSGNIEGIGPRYCPSIEDKIARFADKTSHHVFVEPESATCDEVYPNGLSTSLPVEVQEQYIRSIPGFENAKFARPGYAIEYDFVLPHQLHHTLELKAVPGLFLAGQINGTTGYEEAAGQGLIAGINASLRHRNLPPFVLDRCESYIGVMIDDLVTMSVDEPYRMFTSRAERRLLLRQDNSFIRLSGKAHAIGMIDDALYAEIEAEKLAIDAACAELKSKYSLLEFLTAVGQTSCDVAVLQSMTTQKLSDRAAQTVYAELLYEPYLKRELNEVERRKKFKDLAIPEEFAYRSLPGLSKELQEKLLRHKPATIAQAALIPGMTPAAISLLIFRLRD